MRRFLKSAGLLFGLGLLMPGSVFGQKVVIEDDEPKSVMFISLDKAGDEIVKIMNETQSPRFQDPRAPRFILTDRKGNFALGIGGYVRATAEYDFGGIVKDVDFYPSLIPDGGGNDYARNQFQADITTSTIFLKLVGKTKRLGNFVVYTAGNFRGGNYGFQLQNAYASFLGFTVGYDYGLFMDLAAGPPTIDFAGPNGQTFYRTTQLRYERSFLKHWKAGIGIEMPSVSGTVGNQEAINTQRMPDFPAYIQYGWGKGNHVKFGAIVRSMTYSDLDDEKARSKVGWGTQLSTTFSFCKNFQAFGQVTYGRGIGSFLNDISNLNADLVPNPEEVGRMQVLPMLGWYAGLQYNFSPRFFVSATYSQSKLYDEKGYPADNSNIYRHGKYLVANAFWNVSKNMQVGAEYLRGWRTDYNDQSRHANRINLLVQYSF